MRITVSGHLGFLASHLVDELVKDHEVFGIDNLSGGSIENSNPKCKDFIEDLRDKGVIEKICEEVKAEVLYHFAADATEGRSQFTPISAVENNLNAYMNVLIPFLKNGGRKVVLFSSMSVYGDGTPPFSEYIIRKPVDVYGQAKRMMEEVTEILAEVHGFEYCIIRPHNCYDKNTEVLTSDGFKFFKDLNNDDLIATLNPETNTLEYNYANDWQKFKYKGKLYNLKSKSFDLAVTPEHRLFIKHRSEKIGNGFVLETTESIINTKKYGSRLCCYAENWIGEDKPIHIIPEEKDILGRSMKNKHQDGSERIIPMKLWCEFLGWYISEGCRFKTKMNYVIAISQYKEVNPENYKRIVELIKEMGFNPYITGEKEIRIFSKQLYKELDRLNIGKSREKIIPKEIKKLKKEYLKTIFESLMAGDGNKRGNIYTTNSKKLVDDFSELCLKIGKSTTVYEDNDCYRVSITEKNSPQIGDNRRKEVNCEMIDYDDFVYDITVPNHIIFVRRNGKSCWSSNCYGERQRLDDPYRNVVGIFINRMLQNKPLYIYGDGEQRRAFSYIGDMVKPMVKAMEVRNEIINLGAEKSYSINELARLISKDVKFVDDRPKEVKEAYSTVGKSKKLLGFEDKTSLEKGIKKTIEWAKKQGFKEPKYQDLEIDLQEKAPSTWRLKLL